MSTMQKVSQLVGSSPGNVSGKDNESSLGTEPATFRLPDDLLEQQPPTV